MRSTRCITARLGQYEAAVQETLLDLDQQHVPERIWNKDPSLWKNDPKIQDKIKNRLGWLNIVQEMTKKAEEITAFAQAVKTSGVKTVVLLGMGGSSLCPEVLRKTFGVAEGYPKLIVLDTTDPETILQTEKTIDFKQTLFLLASKSGTTIEMQSLYLYFAKKVEAMAGSEIGSYFMAITDPGSPLETLAQKQSFRKCFLAPSDVGGRYSALTYFGLVPAALIGIDLSAFLKRAEEAIQTSSYAVSENEAMQLGAILGTLGRNGRDKVTLIASESIASFGIWAEQLLAESTGKEGKGLVPIDGEDIGSPDIYGDDRLFIYLRDASDTNDTTDQKIETLAQAGYPVIRIPLRDPFDLAGEFFRWEWATTVAAVILEVNPFDEPNVSESKQNTAEVLRVFETQGELPLPSALALEGEIEIACDSKQDIPSKLNERLHRFLSQLESHHYLALMSYLPMTDKYEALLQTIRLKIRDRYRVATTLGYGPRFLHSTGQLHKGGAGIGRFIQITADDTKDMAIPESGYRFGTLKRAQALGDFNALKRHRLPVMEIRLGKAIESGLKQLSMAI